MGAGGGPEELFREPESRLDASVCRASSGRPASHQLNSTLAEGKRSGRRGSACERAGDSARWVNQRVAEQCVSALRARPLVRARGQVSVTGRGLLGAVHRRYIDDFVLCFQYREDALRVQKALG